MLNLQKNYLQKYPQIHPQHPDWKTIQYKLQLNLGNASVQLKHVYNVTNPYLTQLFEKQNKGNIVSQVYIKPQNLSGNNRIQRVCQKGFQFGNYASHNGMIFQVGQIQGINIKDKMVHQLLIVKICPKKSFLVKSNEQTLSEDYVIPDGFDSLYILDSEADKEIYSHKFRINKKMQTLPTYIIHFTFNNAHEQKFKKIFCQKCEDIVATHYCMTQKVYFCRKCDYQHHKDKISSQHDRTPLTQKPVLSFGYCINHKSVKNQLFCRECNQSMCVSCKVYGSHSQGPMANHPLEKINDYFGVISGKISEMDPNLEKRKDQFQEQLMIVDEKIKQINRTTKKIQHELSQMFQESLRDLNLITSKKLSYLISDQNEIKRQYDYIQWMESFLRYEFNVLPPNNFLISWIKHQKLRKEVLNINNIPVLSDIKPNYRIFGKVKIMDDQKYNQQNILVKEVDAQGENKMERRKSRMKEELEGELIRNEGEEEFKKGNMSGFKRKLFSQS